MRRTALAAVLAVVSLSLTACGGGTSLDAIKVSSGDDPKVTVEKDFTTEKTETRVISEGDGDDTVKTGDTLTVNYIAINGRTGKEFDNSFKNKTPMTLTLNEQTSLPGFKKGLEGQKIGSRVLVAVPSEEGASLLQSADSLGLEKTDTMVFLFDLESKLPTEASGKQQKPPAWLPKLTLDEDKVPAKFEKTAKTPAKLDESGVYVLIKGDGPKVEKGQTATVQYVGQKYPAGEVFDASWSRGTPAPISLAEGAAIPCWTDLIPGQTVGSRVVVACTTEDAYGKDAKKENKPDGPLIFAVDILGAG